MGGSPSFGYFRSINVLLHISVPNTDYVSKKRKIIKNKIIKDTVFCAHAKPNLTSLPDPPLHLCICLLVLMGHKRRPFLRCNFIYGPRFAYEEVNGNFFKNTHA